MNVAGPANEFPFLTDKWQYVKELPPRPVREEELYSDDEESDSEYEGEDEVAYIVLDTAGKLHVSELDRAHEVQIMALESNAPLVRIGHHVFQGTHERLIGSEILLSETHPADGEPSHSVFALASSHLTLEPVQLVPKSEALSFSAQDAKSKGPRAKTGAAVGRPKGSGRPAGRSKKPVGIDDDAVDSTTQKKEKVRRKAKKAAPLQPRSGGDTAAANLTGSHTRTSGDGQDPEKGANAQEEEGVQEQVDTPMADAETDSQAASNNRLTVSADLADRSSGRSDAIPTEQNAMDEGDDEDFGDIVIL